MKIYHLLFLLMITHLISTWSDPINERGSGDIANRDFEKDMEELDLSGLEDDIENIEDIAYRDSYNYITQIYLYVRVDNEYKEEVPPSLTPI
ncbi:conserved Plasmodium protein, unknown function [Plasmodium malariae]|uniref:Fam-a protein n=1 Tax=Plasmodium malariae TaxID=5858 RepID=A0A1C3KYS7_PLAMA|nr:conserved Plasmodium protein, unknown function [Plasmodium malariae]